MPKYTYKCTKCGLSRQTMQSSSVKTITCECGSPSNRLLPKIGGLKNTETVDYFCLHFDP